MAESLAALRSHRIAAVLAVTAAVTCGAGPHRSEASQPLATDLAWQETMLSWRGSAAQLRARIEADFPIQWDWMLQDHGADWRAWSTHADRAAMVRKMIGRVLPELGPAGQALASELECFRRAGASVSDRDWLGLYVRACERRREIRLRPLRARWSGIVFTKHYNLGGSHYAYTEGQSDAQRERHFVPGSALCLLELDGTHPRIRTLIDDPGGVIRDPDVSFDGQRILFAWKKADRKDDYHLYETNVATGEVRQLTFGLGFADYEGAYLPDGDIVFSSTRCVQTVDCWWTEVSNLYTCDGDGRYLRRLGFDQVHTNYPTVLGDGRVIYTRWEYSDRGQIYPQSLFQMNPDGTAQTEFYGNNSWFPTTILHARGIPGTQKVMAVASGHHCIQTGKLIVIDPGKGTQEATGVQLISPVRETLPERIDAYGQHGDVFQYPYPMSETSFLVAYDPIGWSRTRDRPSFRSARVLRTKIYFMTADGRRELLAADPTISCNQPVPLAPRPKPPVRPKLSDHGRETGTYFVQDVYAGQGLKGIDRGTVKRIRVVALGYRAAGIRSNRSQGPAGRALSSTPVAIDNACWDVKVVLGDATVRADGSACFTVPARTPVYFQALDAKGHAVQTMRSWSTLQPGEYFSCVGCHETKSEAPPTGRTQPLALRTGPLPLEPFYGPPRGFSFVREIQPILDQHCVRCHRLRDPIALGEVHARASRACSDDAYRALNDRSEPWNSNDHSIPRFTWWPHKGTREWVQYDLKQPAALSSVEVYWFDDRRTGGRCRLPKSWRLLYRRGDEWREVSNPSGYGVDQDTYNKVRFEGVAAPSLRLDVQLREGFSGGILEWRVGAVRQDARPDDAFSLLGVQTAEPRSGRRWSDAYLALTKNGQSTRLVNWISAQSIPPMLPPYHAGAAKSGLVTMLEKGHKDVRLSQAERDKIACWIDLLVPYCGDYVEANAWTKDELATYEHFLGKRERMAAIERRNVAELAAR